MEITLEELKIISGREGFSMPIIEKDYLVTYLLFLLKDIKGIYFKGGTAINKIFLKNKRLSEDIDFTITRDIEILKKEIKEKLKGTIFDNISKGKEVEGFGRLIVHYKLFHEDGTIFIDLNKREKIILEPEKYKIIHFYNDKFQDFEVNCIRKEELFAEKMRATIERYKPRDYIDMYNLIKEGFKIDMDIVKQKFALSKKKFDVKLIFKNTNKVFILWNKDLSIITKEKKDFKEVIGFLADYFNFKELKKQDKLLLKYS